LLKMKLLIQDFFVLSFFLFYFVVEGPGC
jgi:hypothetical protein